MNYRKKKDGKEKKKEPKKNIYIYIYKKGNE